MPKHRQAQYMAVTVTSHKDRCSLQGEVCTYAQAYAGYAGPVCPVADVAAGQEIQATRSAQSSGGTTLTLTLAGIMASAGLTTDGAGTALALKPRPASCCCVVLSREEIALIGWDVHSTQWCSSGHCRRSCIRSRLGLKDRNLLTLQ